MIHVLLSNGDTAEAETVEDAIVAARTIWDDSIRHGTHTQRVTVIFSDENGTRLGPIVTTRVKLGRGRVSVERASQPARDPVD